MTKDEIIVKYTERILRQNNANDALTETRVIINQHGRTKPSNNKHNNQ
ncbi:MAG: hypothetical protein M0Q19_07795 [Candidatus Cloacimonetes bacterium]|jgi:hypothetical protein|nr:hypothetical protein [Candidatus Cloacimonadota bacterium]